MDTGSSSTSDDSTAFLPRGKDPKHAGRGQGYRIQKTALEAWYFNKPEVK